ncbi:hypothetical protein BD779DRAFT_1784373 [Infundibulicybe gibba]|nr:hypothetical protein BD779DRAFT_1784373 [Infundibulicybe gibba]
MPINRRPALGYTTSPWVADEPSLQVDTEKGQDPTNSGMPTPTTSTVVDAILPAPVLQSQASQSISARRPKRKSARIGLTVHWARFKKRIGTGTAPSSSSLVGDSAGDSAHAPQLNGTGKRQDDDQDIVDEVVVDRMWSGEIKSSISHSDHGASPEKSGGSHQNAPGTSDHESLTPEGCWTIWAPLVILRWRIWPIILEIFSPRFLDEKSEQHYRQENWFLKKSLALWASLWLIANWVLGCSFVPGFNLMDKIFYFGIAPLLSLPVGLMVMFDWPRDRSIIYQCFLILSIWCWPFYQVLYMFLCDYYKNPRRHPIVECGSRDFLATFYYTTAMQTIALFGLKLERFPAAIGAMVFFIFACAAMIPDQIRWARSMINFAVFHICMLLCTHWQWPLKYHIHLYSSNLCPLHERKLRKKIVYLRDQLKVQYKATQKAQINERKAADSKRRLTSYVFHEVRVPLNTALLAVQNMEASGTVARDQEIEFSALVGSLSMMSKVLNDVLDFNRMDSGKFESASRPYAFHQVMRSLFIPLRLATDARGLELITDLDPLIDHIARKAAYEAMGENNDTIRRHIDKHPDVDGVVTGDETRLRQIITNLASNACKFTPAGGQLSITTRLILPHSTPTSYEEAEGDCLEVLPDQHHPLSATYLKQHNIECNKSSPPLEWIVVRIEVTDTGYGIKARDMAQSKLFSAFNQTEQGRQQGGKGTGLGLALVRQIVMLSGGRLGVRSKVGVGSTFWVELPLGVGRKTLINTGPPSSGSDSLATSDLQKVHRAAESNTAVPEAMTNSLTLAVDAAAHKAAQVPLPSTRSSSALHSLMEQGGRVELTLNKCGQPSTTPPTRTIGDPSTGSELPMPHLETTDDLDTVIPTRPLLPGKSSSTATAKQPRPMYVTMPTRSSFSADTVPTSTSHKSNTSSPLTAFDSNYTRGSPASSNPAINIESGLHVLVVDDDPLTRTLMKRILTRLGCHVSTAENGEIALEMILGPNYLHNFTPSSDASRNLGPILEQERATYTTEGKYAVVFLDNQMPVLSGLKAVEKIRDLGRKDFVVGVTGNALLDDQKEYLEAGVDYVLTKPVLEKSLKDMLVLADERRKH